MRAICAYYLIDNFIVKFNPMLNPLFWSICCANSVVTFNALIKELQELNTEAATYLLLAELKL
jgi:hypothetical protein